MRDDLFDMLSRSLDSLDHNLNKKERDLERKLSKIEQAFTQSVNIREGDDVFNVQISTDDSDNVKVTHNGETRTYNYNNGYKMRRKRRKEKTRQFVRSTWNLTINPSKYPRPKGTPMITTLCNFLNRIGFPSQYIKRHIAKSINEEIATLDLPHDLSPFVRDTIHGIVEHSEHWQFSRHHMWYNKDPSVSYYSMENRYAWWIANKEYGCKFYHNNEAAPDIFDPTELDRKYIYAAYLWLKQTQETDETVTTTENHVYDTMNLKHHDETSENTDESIKSAKKSQYRLNTSQCTKWWKKLFTPQDIDVDV